MSLDAVGEPARQATTLVREVAAVPAQANIVRDLVAEWVRHRGLPTDLVEDIRLATYEAMANVCEHAYPDGADGTMTITAAADLHSVVITVADSGHWIAEDSRPHGGRGLVIMRALAPEASVTSTPTGTVIRLAWPSSPSLADPPGSP